MGTLILFAKAPEPGKVKTRLQPHFSAEDSSQLMKAMVFHSLVSWQSSAQRRVLACDPDASHPFFKNMQTQTGCLCRNQSEGHLGIRMLRASKAAMEEFKEPVILLGSDTPTLLPEWIEMAWQFLHEQPFVLGPSFDGGYYLLGLNPFNMDHFVFDQCLCEMFSGLPWGTAGILQQTLEILWAHGQKPLLLPPWWDVDHPQDVSHLYTHLVYQHEKGLGRGPLADLLRAWHAEGKLL